MKFKKTMLIIATLVAAVMMTTSAMAYVLNSRSEEMTANSNCDFAGTITLTFNEEDYNTISAYLVANEAALIRVSLSGTDFAVGSDIPVLCEDIQGALAGTGLGALGGDLVDNLAVLDTIGVEVSDVVDDAVGGAAGAEADGTADVTAYVKGTSGQQYFEIYITGIQNNDDWDNDPLPWIKIGLHDEVITVAGGDDDVSTAICADVHDFNGLAKLTVSIDNTPSSLTTTTSDNQIGHFLVENIILSACTKTMTCDEATDTQIELCPIVPGLQTVSCDTYGYCFAAEGAFPTEGNIEITVRTNGATDGANTQNGIFLRDIALKDEGGGAIALVGTTYYEADGSTVVVPGDCSLVDDVVTFIEAEKVVFTIDAADIAAAGNLVQFCVEYLVDPSQATADTNVMFYASASVVPCGELFNGSMTAAALVECGTIPSCVYMPYVVTQLSPWQTGVAITNLGTAVAPADMSVTFTLTDSTGTSYTYTKDDFTGTVYATFLDAILANFSGTPAAGPAWLLIQANFTVDAYEFLTDGTFGAGTLARPLATCTTVAPVGNNL